MYFTKFGLNLIHPVKADCNCINCLYMNNKVSKDFVLGFNLARHIAKVVDNTKNGTPDEELDNTDEKNVLLQEFSEDELLDLFIINQPK